MSPGASFDLSSVAAIAPRRIRATRRVFWGVGLVLLGLAASLAPGLVGIHATLWLCYAACVASPGSGYWLALSLSMGWTLFLGLFFVIVALWLSRTSPIHLTLSSSGLEFRLPGGKTFSKRWPSRLAYYPLYDYRGAPGSSQRRNPPGEINAGRWVRLTGEAVDGILSAARSVGLDVRGFKVDITKTPSDPGVLSVYQIWGRAKQQTHPQAGG